MSLIFRFGCNTDQELIAEYKRLTKIFKKHTAKSFKRKLYDMDVGEKWVSLFFRSRADFLPFLAIHLQLDKCGVGDNALVVILGE
jgi:hypothetical protein